MRRYVWVGIFLLCLALAAGALPPSGEAVARREDAVGGIDEAPGESEEGPVVIAFAPGRTFTHVEIDYIDYVRLGGTDYHAVGEAALAGADRLGRVVGKVETTVSRIPFVPHRQERSGDAAYLPAGTILRAVRGFPSSFLIAAPVKDSPGGYRLYVRAPYSYAWQYRFLPEEKVQRVEILAIEGENRLRPLRALTEAVEVQDFLALLAASAVRPDFAPAADAGDPQAMVVRLDAGGPVVYQYYVFFDGVDYYWHPWETNVFPAAAAAFFR